MTREELKPCPFCGTPPVTSPVYAYDGNVKKEGLMIECAGVGCITVIASYVPAEGAIAAWNRRV